MALPGLFSHYYFPDSLLDQMTKYEAIVFPCDDRPPHLVQLMTSAILIPLTTPAEPFMCGRMPHPEVFMDYIAEGLGPRAWGFQVSVMGEFEQISRNLF